MILIQQDLFNEGRPFQRRECRFSCLCFTGQPLLWIVFPSAYFSVYPGVWQWRTGRARATTNDSRDSVAARRMDVSLAGNRFLEASRESDKDRFDESFDFLTHGKVFGFVVTNVLLILQTKSKNWQLLRVPFNIVVPQLTKTRILGNYENWRDRTIYLCNRMLASEFRVIGGNAKI